MTKKIASAEGTRSQQVQNIRKLAVYLTQYARLIDKESKRVDKIKRELKSQQTHIEDLSRDLQTAAEVLDHLKAENQGETFAKTTLWPAAAVVVNGHDQLVRGIKEILKEIED